ncbi:uncharacterized protein LOC143541330 [Bidens hawaiensis]|uniref:uncharacterized protein LOC143541330 n=1 Tax=Bidens hawaiensis TaxID=980011 RepID=UPI0040491883
MADDDDDSFGEFTFAPSSIPPTAVNSSQIPTDDDFSSFQNNTTAVKSPPSQPQWQKINGALPLSLFGDEEEEDTDQKPILIEQHDDDDDDKLQSKNFVPNNNTHLGINDLIADLYGPTQQADNANELDFGALNPTVSTISKSNSFTFNTTVVENQGSDDDDEGGWEFIDAFATTNNNHKDHKEHSEKNVASPVPQGGSHEPIDLFAASNNAFFVESRVTDNSVPSTDFQNGFFADLEPDSKSNINESSSNPVGENDDLDDTFGEFETAFVDHSSVKKELPEERFDPLGSHNKSHESVDLFSFSNEAFNGSNMVNDGFDFSQSQTPVVENGFASDPFSQTELKENKDKNFGIFETAFQESGSKPEEFEASKKSFKEPVPLSIFGIEEDLEVDNSLNLDNELFKSSTVGKHTRNLSSNLSINDILSDLYSQAQPISSHVGDVADDNFNNDDYNYDTDDDFIDGSWEFKDASFQSEARNQNLTFEKKVNNCMNLYSNLKDDVCVVASRHLQSLKVGEELKVAALDKEIQEALEKIQQKDDDSERMISLNKYIESFQELDFQILDSEYDISRRLLLAESDLPTAVDLINHFTTVLKILKLASKREAADYVSQWFKVLSVCSQELKHATWIWKQSLEKNIHNEILSEQQGRQFVIAIGEIYRVVMILEASVKLYKPWILLSGADLKGIYGLLQECHSLWSTSGLERSTPADYLLQSIKHIQNLDEIAIANQIISQDEPQCGLSLLSPTMVPEMKMVTWNEDKYFVTLANLWANLISTDPPKSSILVG